MNREIDQDRVYKKKIQFYIKTHYKDFKGAVKDNKELKRQLLLFNIHPYMNISFLAIRKVLRKIKILPQPNGLERINFSFKV